MPEDRPYISYPFKSPQMDQSVPPNQVQIGSFGRLSGTDGRFSGGLRKYYGNKKVVDLDDVSGLGDIDAYSGPSYFKAVTFQKRNTSTVYRGFVVRWDSQNSTSNQQVDLVYTADNGTNWSVLSVWAAGNGITSSLEIDCAVAGAYLMVAVDTKATKTIYWNGASLVCINSGPGAFSATLAAMMESTTSVNTDYQLSGTGTYQVAWRFYDSTRGVYSALSDPVTVRLDHYKTSKATGTISFSSAGGDSGLLIDGDVITINGRTYEADDGGSYTGDVQVDISGLTTIAQMAQALTDAINSDGSAEVTATNQSTSVLLSAIDRGTSGNAITLAVTEYGANTDDMSVSADTLTGGGIATREPEVQCVAVLDLPDHDEVLNTYDYDDFSALFDTIDIFRTIDLGDTVGTTGAIFYLEQTIAKSGNWASSAAWDALQISIGTLLDEALPFQTKYDPEKDIVMAPPQSGTIGRYEQQTYMIQAASVDGGYDTIFSSAEFISPEYFSTYNKRIGAPDEGRPLRFLPAGDSLFQLCYNSIIHIFKSGKLKPVQIKMLHQRRGLVGKEAAHSSGNSIFMISGLGLSVLNGSDGGMGSITAADRVIFDDWKSDFSTVKSGYDSLMSASFFLNPSREELLILWHSTRTCSMIDGANFVGASSGPDITTGRNDRVFFITATGLVLSPDTAETGSGTMWDISSSYTLNGAATSSGSQLVDTSATYHADMVGCKVYMASGDNAGIGRTIATVDTGTNAITFTEDFPYDISYNDRYAISPVPLTIRAWAIQAEEVSRFNRWIVVGASIKARKLSGFNDNSNAYWRVSAYRNSGDSLCGTSAFLLVDSNPAESAEDFNVDGVDIEPYIELISSGVKCELTDLELSLSLSDSRKTV